MLLLLLLGGVVGGVSVLVAGDDAGRAHGPEDSATANVDAAEAARTRPATRRERVRPHPADDGSPASGEAAGESPDDAAVDAPGDEGDGQGSGGAPDSADPAEPTRTLRGRITDTSTGAPVDGVRVLFAAVRDGEDRGWYGATSDAEGIVAHEVPRDFGGPGARYELRIGRRGYEDLVVPLTDTESETGDVEIALVPSNRPPVNGRVHVYASHPDGRPITGIVLVGGSDGLDRLWQWAVADASGTFVLEGVPAGAWTFSLETADKEVETIVPDGGETRVQLVGPATPWPPAMTAVEFDQQHALLRSRERSTTDASLDPEQREQADRGYVLAVQRLETDWRAVAPRREVAVEGLPTDGPAWLRVQASNGPQNFWRQRIHDGAVQPFDLTMERWAFRIERPEGNGPWHRVEVVEGVEGDEAQIVTLPVDE